MSNIKEPEDLAGMRSRLIEANRKAHFARVQLKYATDNIELIKNGYQDGGRLSHFERLRELSETMLNLCLKNVELCKRDIEIIGIIAGIYQRYDGSEEEESAKLS